MNLLVQTSKTPDSMFRASIAARGGQNAAEAGTSWISSRFAEVYVQVHESVRRRGLGKSVVSAVSQSVIDARRTPLYVAREDSIASHRLAERLGYRDSGAVELSAAIARRAP
jgi:predicted GNAT family acetyltransferase